jgi:hypothetical protein
LIWAIALPHSLELETDDLVQRMIDAGIEANWPTETDPNVCRHCRRQDDNLIPMGYGPHPRIWLHRNPCFDAYRAEMRRRVAVMLGLASAA